MIEDNDLLIMKNIDKTFPGVRALNKVSINLKVSEVLGLVGENGAGKTTLMNILNGILLPDNGRIILNGKEVKFNNPFDAQNCGIAYIHQELNLIDELSVTENMFLGRELTTSLKIIDYKKMYERSKKILSSLDIDVDPNESVGNLPLAIKQMVEIAKILMFEAQIIVMDEPTSSFTEEEIEILFQLIKRLRNEGKSIIYISHRLEEVFQITDRVIVLRNGQYVGTKITEEIDINQLVKMMVGIDVKKRFFKEKSHIKENILEVKNLVGPKMVNNFSFNLRKGEIIGIAGLIGSGRTELVETIFGITPPKKGQIRLKGESFYPSSPNKAIKSGIAYVPEDRKLKGLFLDFSILENIYITKVEKEMYIINESQAAKSIEKLIDRLNIVTPSIWGKIKNLSGGNRQKVILARWMFTEMDVLLINEPTRGIDVRTKVEIYKLLYKLNRQGVGIVMVSSELSEILVVSDRIIVMYEGKINGEFTREEANRENILKAMTGHCG